MLFLTPLSIFHAVRFHVVALILLIGALAPSSALHAAVYTPPTAEEILSSPSGSPAFKRLSFKERRKLRKERREQIRDAKGKKPKFWKTALLLALANVRVLSFLILLSVGLAIVITLNPALLALTSLALLLGLNVFIIQHLRPEMPVWEKWLWALGVLIGGIFILGLFSLFI